MEYLADVHAGTCTSLEQGYKKTLQRFRAGAVSAHTWSAGDLVGSLRAKKQQLTTIVATISRSNHGFDTSRYAASSNMF